ncbi:hypothetical protein [Pedococcus sp. 5OH_020]|uniref:hypothetical protein n=1 Tax=Pedococcus sp. 5OH_020 TaxID=2989814 RepID=UPI0022E9A020|nr:hypothetical protein [Pedococcus sp. 5OH_020]
MRVVHIVLVGAAVMFTAACGTGGDPAAAQTPTAPVPASASACASEPQSGNSLVMVDWVDFVQLHGVQYIAGMDGQVPPVSAATLGPVVGHVQCQLSLLKFQQTPGPAVDGDAGFLAAGTPVRAIAGFEPTCRLAARIDGQYRVYLAHHDAAGVSRAVSCARAPRGQ